ncbi:MAG: CHASE domain-containing protein, partial [Methylocapsa sp.]|nr:CHASE domain-containing protein [Methylocapsa sp.]
MAEGGQMFRPESLIRALVQRQLLIYAVMPIVYLISGRLALLLAVPPGYATAVFPPAGIAVAAMFMAGAATLPGTFLGAFLLNISLGYSVANRLDAISVAAALAIAFGHFLQAAVGGTALRHVIGYPAPLDNPRDLILFLALSPVFCLTSSSLSLSAMWALGAVRSSDLITNWVTWWVGDTLGVLVVSPLMLALMGQPRPLWRSRARFVAVPMMLCFALFTAVFIRLSGWENERSLREFQLRSQQLADAMKEAIEEQALYLEQLSAVFVNRNLVVSRQDFHDLVQKLRQRFPAIQAVEWAPRVMSSERRAFEAAQAADLPGFIIRERDSLDQLRPAGERGQFYPVTYLEPFPGNAEAAGFDLASDADRREAIEFAIASGRPTATNPVRLVQERGQEAGLLLVNAVPGGPTGPGVVLVVLRMGLSAMTLAEPLASTLRLRLLDAVGARPLFDNLPPSAKTSYETAFDFGTRHYALQTAPSAIYMARHRGWQSFTVLAAGALSTGLLGALLLLGTGHAYRFARLADILNSIPTVVYVLAVRAEGFPSQWISGSVKRILGYEVEEALAADWWIGCVHPDDREAAIKKTAILMTQGRLAQEYRFRSKNGRYLWMQDEATLLREADGRPKEIVGFWTNISERKCIEQANLALIGELQHRTR